jgi:HEAT repeat protein
VSEPIQQIALHALVSASPYEAIPAAIILASAENAVAAEHLARFAGDRSIAREWRIAAYRALEWIPLPESEPRNMAAAIGTGLRDQRDADVRRGAIKAAGRWLAPDRHGEIRRALASDDTLTVRAALIATRYLDETGALEEIGALEYTADILPLFDADSLTRYEAARTLAQIGYSDAQTINYLVLTLTHDDADKRHAAVEAIRILARRVFEEGRTDAYATSLEPATKWLTEIARTEDVAWRREHALLTLRYLPSFESEEALGLGSEDPAECVRIVAAEGLAETRGDVALPVIRMIYRDASEAGRLRIVDAVGRIGSEKAYGMLREISVLDASAKVRANARNFLSPSTQGQQPAV